jgi:putative membrane protein insertion efficiency factor
MPEVHPPNPVSRAAVRALSGLIWAYQKTLSPALGVIAPMCGCRFAPTCSHYAQEALREHGVLAGLALALVRLAKCGPWHPGGLDPVPPRRFACISVKASAPAERPLLTAQRSLS